MIYLDWASTTPPDLDTLLDAARVAAEHYGNPSSAHGLGRAANARLEEARSGLLALLEPGRTATSSQGKLVFTGSGSEADVIPLLALLRKASMDGSKPHIVLSEIEHAAIHQEVEVLRRFGLKATFVKPEPDGLLRPEAVAAALKPETEAVFVMAVNNETGAIQPVAGIAKAVTARAAAIGRKQPRFHVDAVQAFGKIDFAPAALGIDSAAVSAHKFRGPRGAGVLWLAREMEPLVVGGGQEGGMRPGTESLQDAWAMYRTAAAAVGNLEQRRRQARLLEKRLLEGLEAIGALPLPLGRRSGDDRYSPFILSAAFPGLSGEVLVRSLAEGAAEAPGGVAVSTGAACSTNAHRKGRRILEAMGLDPALCLSSIRVSIGELTTMAEIETFLAFARVLYSRLKA